LTSLCPYGIIDLSNEREVIRMENKVAEMVGIMMKNKEAKAFFMEGWFSPMYFEIMSDPVEAMKQGEQHKLLNKLCGMALLDWYACQEV
jgi:hypothetical protein